MTNKGPLRRFLENREPLLKRGKVLTEEDEVTEKMSMDTPVPLPTEKPLSGKTFAEQSDTLYCVECLEGHTMASLTEMRHAIDRCRTADGKMTPGVTEKVRIALGELMGIPADVVNTRDAPPDVKKELDEILDKVRWLRKDSGVSGKGLTSGSGTLEDLEELRNEIFKLQTKAYALLENCPTCKRITHQLGETL